MSHISNIELRIGMPALHHRAAALCGIGARYRESPFEKLPRIHHTHQRLRVIHKGFTLPLMGLYTLYQHPALQVLSTYETVVVAWECPIRSFVPPKHEGVEYNLFYFPRELDEIQRQARLYDGFRSDVREAMRVRGGLGESLSYDEGQLRCLQFHPRSSGKC